MTKQRMVQTHPGGNIRQNYSGNRTTKQTANGSSSNYETTLALIRVAVE